MATARDRDAKSERQTDKVGQTSDDSQGQGSGLGKWGGYLLFAVIAVSLVSHAWNMFNYPQYLGDEGIYLEQAWSVLREHKLSPYTYFYDHAPAGWLIVAAWIVLLPQQFLTFGMAVNSGRVLMLLMHVASVFFLYRITLHLTKSNAAAAFTSLVYTLSPLVLYYTRLLLLDNILIFWLLISLYLIVRHGNRLMTIIGSGTALGLALLTKENAIFFVPIMGYALYREVRGTYRFRFALTGWAFTAFMIVSLYPLYAVLKGELVPSGGEHVSLVDTLYWQLFQRHGGSIMDPNGWFWKYFWSRWWAKDPVLLTLGGGAAIVNLLVAMLSPKLRQTYLLASLLVISFSIYLMRGSVILEFYVLPILPFMALNLGLLAHLILGHLPRPLALGAFGLAILVFAAGDIQASVDHYTLNLTQVQIKQLQWIRQNIPPNSILMIDDDLWVDLHEKNGRLPVYPNAHSHWKIQTDPDIKTRLLKNNWRNIDWVVMSPDLIDTFHINYDQTLKANPNGEMVLNAYNNSVQRALYQKGNTIVQVRQVQK
ncbi:MAG: phospholipid carrier-dependent glycosyltransferase [Chloroflexota bacterium]|nr:MAG: phospholipid carrier-dependent glycosyltransferase [Chloroflexota bacterium]